MPVERRPWEDPMTEDDPVRRAAQYRVDRETAREAAEASAAAGAPSDGEGTDGGGTTDGDGAARPRLPLENRGQWVDELVRQAM
ncbi:hypothetical protein DLJ96_09285, partial [Actinotalea fermentans ATCC 43279 = JCM 9966 = DSM 3133]